MEAALDRDADLSASSGAEHPAGLAPRTGTERQLAPTAGLDRLSHRPRLGPFELIEAVIESPALAVARARRLIGQRQGDVVRVIVERRASRDARVLERLYRLQAPGVARLLSFGRLQDGRAWYELEAPRGPTVEQVLREVGPVPLERALTHLSQLLDSLGRVHAAGLVHGAIDARRVVLAPGERPLLLDTGLAGRHGVPDDPATALITAPEVWRGAAPDARSDLYAAGVLVHLLLTGRAPFRGEDVLETCRAHLHQVAPALSASNVPATAEVEQVVEKLLAKGPTRRWSSADVARAAVERALLRLRAVRSRPWEHDVLPPSGYRFLRRLGEGGNGAVYEAVHEVLEKAVAVKVLHTANDTTGEVRARFLREARIAASLEHPGVVRLHDAREEGDRLYLIMELVDGEPLKDRLSREGALSESTALAISRQVLDALASAHAIGIVHRDVKPDNILVDAAGRVKLADFGLARPNGEDAGITQAGYVLGTPYYMAPEQCRGHAIDGRADLYAFGATLFQMLTGRMPFVADTVVAILEKQLHEAPPSVRKLNARVSPVLAAIVERLLAKDPAARFATCAELQAALDRVAV